MNALEAAYIEYANELDREVKEAREDERERKRLLAAKRLRSECRASQLPRTLPRRPAWFK